MIYYAEVCGRVVLIVQGETDEDRSETSPPLLEADSEEEPTIERFVRTCVLEGHIMEPKEVQSLLQLVEDWHS